MTGKDLIECGIKPGLVFTEILKLTKDLPLEEAKKIALGFKSNNTELKKRDKLVILDGSILKWFFDHNWIRPHTKEPGKGGLASNSEIIRWLKNGSIRVNNIMVKAEDNWPHLLIDLVFFPTSNLRVTFF